jgi:hypothetical protein
MGWYGKFNTAENNRLETVGFVSADTASDWGEEADMDVTPEMDGELPEIFDTAGNFIKRFNDSTNEVEDLT